MHEGLVTADGFVAPYSNKDMNMWDFSKCTFNEKQKTTMRALMIQIMVLIMTNTTCYSFGGQVFRQKNGLGIGLRGSAALARLTMCKWDSAWGRLQKNLGLNVQCFFRYVDDIRFYLKPLNKGWCWVKNKWEYLENDQDVRSAERRTVEEVGKSLEAVWEFLKFTCETETDFEGGFLPTLDFMTHVMDDGYVQYKFFSKPMTNNIVLQRGTGLSKGCIFSSLRQDLVRRLLNTDLSQGSRVRNQVIEDFIQLMTNSGHTFVYIKSVILQAITKYGQMVDRNNLPVDDKKYMPLHRDRDFNCQERKLIKYVNHAVWYTDKKFGDKYKNDWKRWIVRKQTRSQKSRRKKLNVRCAGKITTTLFVPKTPNGKLMEIISRHQDDLNSKVDWRMKLTEKPGTPLWRKFRADTPMSHGCQRGLACPICDDTGVGCSVKNVVYQATCLRCEEVSTEVSTEKLKDERGEADETGMNKGQKGQSSVYVGETSRHFGTRAMEHWNSLWSLKKDSFMLAHWMDKHGTEMIPPDFKFKIHSSHKDPLSRQLREAIFIRQVGNLNRRDEYAFNEVIRMEASTYDWEKRSAERRQTAQGIKYDACLDNFISVILSVDKYVQTTPASSPNNPAHVFRVKKKRDRARAREDTLALGGSKEKRRKMFHTSTPVHIMSTSRRDTCDIDSSVDSSADVNSGEKSTESSVDVDYNYNKSETGHSFEMKNIRIAPAKMETFLEQLASSSIANKEHCQAEEFFRKRSRSLPAAENLTRVIVREGKLNRKSVRPLSLTELMKDIDLDQWDNDMKFKRYHSDSKSFDQDEGEHVTDENVVDLFQHEKDQVNENELKYLIEEKSINKFKRKVSPPVGIPGSKSRRSSVDQSASPSLRDRERISLMEYEGRLNSNA